MKVTLALLLRYAAAYEVCIGQDFYSIRNYSAAFGTPACVMSYASVRNLTAALWTGQNYGSGIEHAKRLLDASPGADLQLGLWLVGAEADLAKGDLHDAVGELVGFAAWAAPRTVYVRVGYEFDNPGNRHEPGAYVAAYRVVADALAAAPNARSVWHSWAFYETYEGHNFSAWWPGADAVDLCGVSVFQQGYGDSPLGGLGRAAEVAAFCAEHGKPLMVAESTPFGLVDVEPRATIWRRWFEPTLDFVYEHDVVLWSYINCDWDAQPMWRGNGWGDSRLEADDTLAARWRDRVLGRPTVFLLTSSAVRGSGALLLVLGFAATGALAWARATRVN